MKRIYATTSVVVALGLVLTSQLASAAQAASPQPDKVGISDVNVQLSQRGRVEKIVLKTPFKTGAINVRSTPSSSPVAGIKDIFGSAANSEFILDPISTSYLKRFNQIIAGVPVLGSSITQVLNGEGDVTSAIGAVSKATQGSFPVDAKADQVKAAQAASQFVVQGQPGKTVVLSSQRQIWFDQTLAGVAGQLSAAVPGYEFVFGVGVGEARTVLVAANEKHTILQDRSDHRDINRVICDRDSKVAYYDSDLKCGKGLANTLSRTEGQSAASVSDVNAVYNFLGDTSSFYADNTKAADLTGLIGLDEGDGLGKALRAVVRVCVDGEPCPLTNAFWGAGQMTYGQGVTTDDITGHELTHGVTEKVNGLAYQNESGAINESMSDVFGEFVDLTNGSSDDTASARWQIGEGSELGVIRSMKDPTLYKDPAIYKGTNWKSTVSNPNKDNDYGGVHTNSGVGNKLAFLITDGQQFNGQTVQGIGITKAAQLYWAAQVLLTSNATYSTLASALNSACSANVSNNVAGTTSADCTQVGYALKAVNLG